MKKGAKQLPLGCQEFKDMAVEVWSIAKYQLSLEPGRGPTTSIDRARFALYLCTKHSEHGSVQTWGPNHRSVAKPPLEVQLGGYGPLPQKHDRKKKTPEPVTFGQHPG